MRAVDAEFVMQVRSGRQSGHADETDRLTLVHALADALVGEARHMAVGGADVLVVLDDDEVAVAGFPAAEHDRAVAGGVDRGTGRRGVVDALVRARVAEDGMLAGEAEEGGYARS